MTRILALVTVLLALASPAWAQAVIVPSSVPVCSNGNVLQWQTSSSNFVCASIAAASQPFDDSMNLLGNHSDATKLLRLDVSGIATATTRTWTVPNVSGTVLISGASQAATLAAITASGLVTANGGVAATTITASSTLSVTGTTAFNGVTYAWPGSQGAAGTFAKNDGSGNISWGTQSAALPSPISQDVLLVDATYDIGKSGATRPRDGFFSRNVDIGGTLGVTGASTIAALSATSGTFSTTLGVTGASTLAAMSATSGSFSSIVTITGNLTLSGTGNAVGTITSGIWNAGAVTSSGAIGGTAGTFSTTLGVTGISTLTGATKHGTTGTGIVNANTAGVIIGMANDGTVGAGYMQISFANDTPLFINRGNDGTIVDFFIGGVLKGNISNSGSTTSYNASSDQRLKNDVGPATDVAVLQQTRIHNFTWKLDGLPGLGVFAQEAIRVNPVAITKGKNETLGADGLPLYPWGVDYSKYVPNLIVGWQDHDARIAALEAKLAKEKQ